MFKSTPAHDAGFAPGSGSRGAHVAGRTFSAQPKSGPGGPSEMEERTLLLVDLENLAGSSEKCTPDAVRGVRQQFLDVADARPEDHVVVAFGPTAAKVGAMYGWDGNCVKKIRHGIDGADLELISIAETELTRERYGRVVFGSGDGIFADVCATAKDQGIYTTVVAPDQVALSHKMLVADEVRLLEVPGSQESL